MIKGYISEIETMELDGEMVAIVKEVMAAYPQFKVGRNDIREGVFAIYSKADPLRSVEQAPLEAHNSYIDIQIVINGQEIFGISNRENCLAPRGEFDTERDIIFFDDAPKQFHKLTSDMFIVLYPNDAHAPLIGEGSVEKIVVKIAVER